MYDQARWSNGYIESKKNDMETSFLCFGFPLSFESALTGGLVRKQRSAEQLTKRCCEKTGRMVCNSQNADKLTKKCCENHWVVQNDFTDTENRTLFVQLFWTMYKQSCIFFFRSWYWGEERTIGSERIKQNRKVFVINVKENFHVFSHSHHNKSISNNLL